MSWAVASGVICNGSQPSRFIVSFPADRIFQALYRAVGGYSTTRGEAAAETPRLVKADPESSV